MVLLDHEIEEYVYKGPNTICAIWNMLHKTNPSTFLKNYNLDKAKLFLHLQWALISAELTIVT